ncbi:MAG TPA: flagellar protein FlaG [Bryobacteraceae bacterium]|nr:flagellar protein FlaG [Bryobacteraceae bacterium]
MGQVSGTPLWNIPLPETQSPSHTQAIAAAVRTINESGIVGPDRQVTFSTDSASRELVIRVVDKQSRDVLVQWPSDYALNLAAQVRKENRIA